jgi:P4 family phage/plasmid primase-like protien
MNDRDDKTEETNVKNDKDHQAADAIPAIVTDSGVDTDDDEWAHLLPCAQKMLKDGVSDGASVVAYTLSRHLRSEKIPQKYTLATLLRWNNKNSPPLDKLEIEECVTAAYAARSGRSYNALNCANETVQKFCDDDCPLSPKRMKGEAAKYFHGKTFVPKLLADELVQEHKFIYSGERLHAYANGFYSPDGDAFAKRKCREKLHYEANIASVSETISHICDMTYTETDRLNTFHNLINLENCMLDWRSGKMLSHSPHYLSTIRIPVAYDPNAKCPEIDKFLLSILNHDCIDLVEEMLGYLLIPDVRFQKAFVLTGSGSNAKSTFVGLTESFIDSSNISKVPLQELDGHKFKRAELFGMLANIFSDIDSTDLESSSYFKAIVSGDQIDCERKFKNPFFFKPYARLLYSANLLPRSPDSSYAFYRRLIIINFPNSFIGKQADKNIINRITQPEELSGLLLRALSGLRRLFANNGFTESDSVKEALSEYKRWNDPVAAFVMDKCDLTDLNGKIDRTVLYNAFTRYCAEEGFGRASNQIFYKRIKSYPGICLVEGDDGKYFFKGIKPKIITTSNDEN